VELVAEKEAACFALKEAHGDDAARIRHRPHRFGQRGRHARDFDTDVGATSASLTFDDVGDRRC